MAEGDNQARFGAPGVDREIAAGVAKNNPTTKGRLPEDGNVDGRSEYYSRAGQKDRLPEHQARRDAMIHINAE